MAAPAIWTQPLPNTLWWKTCLFAMTFAGYILLGFWFDIKVTMFNFSLDPRMKHDPLWQTKTVAGHVFFCSAINIPSTCLVYHHCVCIMGNPNLHASLEGRLNRTNSWTNNISWMFFHQSCWLSTKIVSFTTHLLSTRERCGYPVQNGNLGLGKTVALCKGASPNYWHHWLYPKARVSLTLP